MKDNKIAAVVLAGGKGKRMQSTTPKVLHHIVEQPMVFYTLQTLEKSIFSKVFVVVQNEDNSVKKEISSNFKCDFVYQLTPLGTAHAVKSALKKIPSSSETILVLNGDDSAFYSVKTLEEFIKSHLNSKAVLSALTLKVKENNTIGRVIRDKNGQFEEILELKEYLLSGLKSDEINCGCYLFNIEWLKENIEKVQLSMTGEYYITDLLNIAKQQKDKINLFNLENEEEWAGINNKQELKIANEMMEKRLKTSN